MSDTSDFAGDVTAEVVPWRAREAPLLFFLSYLVLAVVMAILALALSTNDSRAIAGVLVQELALFIIVIAWVRGRYSMSNRSLGLRSPTRDDAVWGLGTAVIGILSAVLLSGMLGQVVELVKDTEVSNPEQIPLDDTTPSAAIIILIAVGVIILAPLAEEVFWRGFLMKSFKRWMSPTAAVVTSSVLFGLAHLSAARTWELAAEYVFTLAIPIAVLGGFLGRSLERTGSLMPAIFAHALFNVFGFVFFVRGLGG